MKALVTGGTGTIGRTLVNRLLAYGWEVVVLSRRTEIATLPFKDRVTYVNGEITDRQKVTFCVRDVDAVFHLAAKLEASGGANYREFERINVDGTKIVADGCRKADVKKLVFASSISVYGRDALKSAADETTPLNPDSCYSLSKARAEEIVLKTENRNGQKIGVVLRVASVYGPKEKTNYSLLIKSVRSGIVLLPGRGAHKRTLVHDHDFAEAAVAAALNKSTSGKTYNVTDGRVYRMREITDAIAKAMRKKCFYPAVPVSVEKNLLKLLHIFSINGTVDKLSNNKAARGGKIQKELGFKPLYSLDKGWADAVKRCLK